MFKTTTLIHQGYRKFSDQETSVTGFMVIQREVISQSVEKYRRQQKPEAFEDLLAVEEPLEIRLGSGTDDDRSLSVTMRTPENDLDLALGFLWTEGIIQNSESVAKIQHSGTSTNVIRVQLSEDNKVDWDQHSRHFYTTSSCGVCGKTSIEALYQKSVFADLASLCVDSEFIYSLPNRLLEIQKVFSRTGGLHAATLFSAKGAAEVVREDVGRHNALDKLIGWALQNEKLPLDQNIVLLSGRASFELIQKSYMAGLQIVVAIGAPSSLAVQSARDLGITLIGFTKEDRFNIYCGNERIGESK